MLNDALPENPEWLTSTFGPPPRYSFSWKLLKFMLKKRCWPSGVNMLDQVSVLAHAEGIATWAILIKANCEAYNRKSKGDKFYGVVLIAPEIGPSEAMRRLPPIGDRISEHRGSKDLSWSAELSAFMEWVDDDIMHDLDKKRVPQVLADELPCMLVTGLFFKAHMPGGALAMNLLPMLYLETEAQENYAVLADPKVWSSSYKKQWLSESRKRRAESQGGEFQEKDNFPNMFALEVTGIPPQRLSLIESETYRLCDERKLTCLFLNVGSLKGPDEHSVPRSGELQFLGVDEQSSPVAGLLITVLKANIAEDDMNHVRLTGLRLDELFARFEWLLEEFGRRR